MNSEEAKQILSAAWEQERRDPMARLVAACDAVAADKIRLSWPAEVINDLADRRRAELVAAALPLISTGRFDYQAQNAALETFASGLESDIQRERKVGGRLRDWSRDDQIVANAAQLMAWLHNGHEINCLRQELEEGEVIKEVRIREIVTDRRTIGRDAYLKYRELHQWPHQYAKLLTSEKVLTEKENELAIAAARAVRPFSADSGPTPERETP